MCSPILSSLPVPYLTFVNTHTLHKHGYEVSRRSLLLLCCLSAGKDYPAYVLKLKFPGYYLESESRNLKSKLFCYYNFPCIKFYFYLNRVKTLETFESGSVR